MKHDAPRPLGNIACQAGRVMIREHHGRLLWSLEVGTQLTPADLHEIEGAAASFHQPLEMMMKAARTAAKALEIRGG